MYTTLLFSTCNKYHFFSLLKRDPQVSVKGAGKEREGWLVPLTKQSFQFWQNGGEVLLVQRSYMGFFCKGAMYVLTKNTNYTPNSNSSNNSNSIVIILGLGMNIKRTYCQTYCQIYCQIRPTE